MTASDQPISSDPPNEGFEPPSVNEMGAQLPQYELRALIGQGGMGVVYQGYQRQLDRKVAIKVLRPDAAMGAEDWEHFRAEARAMARLQHTNIVAAYDFGETPTGLHYIVMEYAEGATLFDLIQDGVLDQGRVLDILGQVCAALQYAHGRGVIHRDVKPANILVGPDGRVKIADFGLAKLRGAVGGLGDANLGTPEYAAPEVRDPRVEVDHRADIYSTGVLVFEMLVGEAPAPGSNDVPSRHVDCDPRFDRIVSRATNILPSGRYRQVSEIAAEIEGIRAQPVGRHLRVGAAASKARKGRACRAVARPVGAGVPTPVKAAARKPGPSAVVVRPAKSAPSPLRGGAKSLPGSRARRARPGLRVGSGSGAGGAPGFLFVLFAVVVAAVIWAASAFKNRQTPGSGGAPEGEGADPLEEAESSVR